MKFRLQRIEQIGLHPHFGLFVGVLEQEGRDLFAVIASAPFVEALQLRPEVWTKIDRVEVFRDVPVHQSSLT